MSQAKLIAEPWDVGQADSYDIGRFPPDVERVERPLPGHRPRLLAPPRRARAASWRRASAARPTSTAAPVAGPTASVNLVTVHDGFTLRDLVSYDAKHNEANGEGNRDGNDDNRSWNCGVEGPTDDPDVLALRARQSARAADARCCCRSACRCCSAATSSAAPSRATTTPTARTTTIVWFDWSTVDGDLLDFTRRLIALRRAHPVFRRRRFLSGAAASALAWYTPAGTRMTSADWADPNARCLTIHLDGTSDPDRAEDGTPRGRRRLPRPRQRLVGAADLHDPRPRRVAARGSGSWTPTTRPRWTEHSRWRPAAHSRSARVRSSSCAAPAERRRWPARVRRRGRPHPDTVHVRESRTLRSPART